MGAISASGRRGRRWATAAVAGATVVGGAVLAPSAGSAAAPEDPRPVVSPVPRAEVAQVVERLARSTERRLVRRGGEVRSTSRRLHGYSDGRLMTTRERLVVDGRRGTLRLRARVKGPLDQPDVAHTHPCFPRSSALDARDRRVVVERGTGTWTHLGSPRNRLVTAALRRLDRPRVRWERRDRPRTLRAALRHGDPVRDVRWFLGGQRAESLTETSTADGSRVVLTYASESGPAAELVVDVGRDGAVRRVEGLRASDGTSLTATFAYGRRDVRVPARARTVHADVLGPACAAVRAQKR